MLVVLLTLTEVGTTAKLVFLPTGLYVSFQAYFEGLIVLERPSQHSNQVEILLGIIDVNSAQYMVATCCCTNGMPAVKSWCGTRFQSKNFGIEEMAKKELNNCGGNRLVGRVCQERTGKTRVVLTE